MLAAIMIYNNLRILPLTLKLSKAAHPIPSSHDGEEIPLVAGDWVKISDTGNLKMKNMQKMMKMFAGDRMA